MSEGQLRHWSVGRSFSVALKGFVPNIARYNEWVLNFESWSSHVTVKESFPHDVLLTDDPKLLCSCLRNYVSITARCNKWVLNNFG